MSACHTHRHWFRSVVWWRRIVQVLTLAAFLVLVWRGHAHAERSFAISPTASLVFWLDPLASYAALTAGMVVASVLACGLAMLLASLLVGRAFCGWLCPLGTVLDIARRSWSPVTGRLQQRLGRRTATTARLPLAVLIVTVIALPLGLPLLGFVEPFAILERALATAIIPGSAHLGDAVAAWFRPAIDHTPAPGLAGDFRFVGGAPLRAATTSFAGAGICLGLLIALLAAEAVQPRWWCRTLCPTGALFGLLSRWSLAKRLPLKTCGTCNACAAECHLGAFITTPATRSQAIIPAACTLCMRCVEVCPQSIATVGRSSIAAREASPVDLSRRGFLVAAGAGAALPFIPGLRHATDDPFRLRPPGVAAGGERRFLDACIRCGACVQACPTHALQPVLLADGVGGVFAPRLTPRAGACEHACTACGTVCPTGAIPLLGLATKQRTAMGVAIHDHRRCLPWAVGAECRVCQEHCPVADKAIVLKMGRSPDGGTVPLPTVVADRCIGCGTCEYVCPLEGEAAIRVVAREGAEAMRRVLQPTRRGP